MIEAIRHHQTDKQIISGFFFNPLKRLGICFCTIVPFIVLQKVNPHITYTQIDKIPNIAFYPLFRAFLVHIDPKQLTVEAVATYDVAWFYIIRALYFGI